MFRRICVWILMVSPALTFAASREMQDLQRDVALLQQQVTQLQQSQDKQLAALTVLVQQALDAANRANTSVAVIQNGFERNLQQQREQITTPVVGLSTRMDQLSNNMTTLQQAVSDLTNMMQKLQAQMTDLGNAVKVMQAPAPPPPGSTSSPSGPSPSGAAMGNSPDTPTMPASQLYDSASRDRQSGNMDLALEEFRNYLKWYGKTDYAPNAQFYIAFIHYSQGDYTNAANEFDAVLEKYPENNKTEDALFYKAKSLMRMGGHKTQAGQEFTDLIKRYPKTDEAVQACSELQNMGLHCPTPVKAARRKAH